MDLPIIETKRLLLRPVNKSDIEDLYALYSNHLVVRYTGDLPWTEKQEADDFISSVQGGLIEESLFGWCIELKESNQLIGTCALFDCELDKRVAELSYEIVPAYWGRGFTSEIIPLVIEFAFKTLGLNRINAFVDSRNIASLKLLAKNHFQREGLMRESWIDSSGNPADDHVLGLLQKEWLSSKDFL